jgi:ATP/maltotriose-dependent transcriptional regulator MalT
MAVAIVFWCDDLDGAERETEAALEYVRARGDFLGSAYLLLGRSIPRFWRGSVADAAADAEAAARAWRGGWSVSRVIASYWHALALLEQGALSEAEAALGELEPGWPPYHVACWHSARGRLALARGDARTARVAMREAEAVAVTAPLLRNGITYPWRSDAALAAHAAGDREDALRLVQENLANARAFGAPRSLGIALRAAGLVHGSDHGLACLEEATQVLEDSPSELEWCRALVDLGAARRRAGARAEAREPLRHALDLARRLGARALEERAFEELRAAGARPRRRDLSGPDALTPTERRVAEMAADGMANPEIAQVLFVSRKTIEWHLGHVYSKLGVTSRGDLRTALGSAV